MKIEEAINNLVAKVCRCGAPKVRRTAFCGSCYAALPAEMQRDLWKRIGKGFEAAYEAAIARLEADGVLKAEKAV